MDDLLSEFLTETAESLTVVDGELVKLERDPGNKDVLGRIFRLVHTIKGTCGFIGLPRLEKVAHASENMLGKFRDGVLAVSPAAVTLILESLDLIKSILAQLEASGAEPAGDDSDIIARLELAAEGGEIVTAGCTSAAPQEVAPIAASAPVELPPAEPPQMDDQPDPAAPKGADAKVAATPGASVVAQSIRVNVDVLEDLMTMVSELVLTRNQLMEMVRHSNDSEFKAPLQRLSNVTAELQESVMKTRMQPIGNAWQKLPRIVRDLANELGKKIDLQMKGAETELDRQVLELIKDPLTHMVRNSADHGLELPADRKRAGKGDTGTITLSAYHEGGHILIEVSDDGRGLDMDKIKAKALASGLASEAELAAMSENQVHRFIFHAGFSTAAKVTNVSGRGVGMDVVRSNIELIGGSIDLKSAKGQGTRFIIKIPLTLAIVSALIFGVGGMRFAIPQICVQELVRSVPGSDTQVERINATPVLRLRNRLLPLIPMPDVLRLDGRPERGEEFIIVAQANGRTFGIVVDSVFDTEEIVVKPVSSLLRDIPVFSGTTILGDGSVIMIIDPNGLAAQTGSALHAKTAQDDDTMSRTGAMDVRSLLLFTAGSDEPKAVPLSLVTRLEELKAGRIEFLGGRHVVQYRGKLMPIVPVCASQTIKRDAAQAVLVFSDEDKTIGLAVDSIIDIVDETMSMELHASRPGLLGTAVIKERATDVIDISHYLGEAFQYWFAEKAPAQAARKRLLLVDDSAFFRNMLGPLLT
ncbi:MAG TPA: hybrid sensor histidine kinase/response regulator, partial [Alphaproteobacteria bacterium]|nr:hybrid sensor histidine kinase/response regulator [Alphaproteobacteria bacterium]